MTRDELKTAVIEAFQENENGNITAEVLRERVLEILDNVAILGEDSGLRAYNPEREEPYLPGEGATYQGQVFTCSTETSGAFNQAHWTLTGKKAVVNTIEQRDALFYRFEGIDCYVIDEGKTFSLVGGIAPENWIEAGGSQQTKKEAIEVEEDGQQAFITTVNDSQYTSTLFLLINGVAYDTPDITVSIDEGTNKVKVVWEAIDKFILETTDQVYLIYK